MTTEEAKRAVKEKLIVLHKDYEGFEWYATGIITWYQDAGWDRGWRNTLRLVPVNGINSSMDALMRDCTLK